MKAIEVLNYLAWADDFVMIVRKDDRLVTVSDTCERGMHELIMLAAECLIDDFEDVQRAMLERVGETVH
jgi:hypothetical protein